MKVKLEVDIYNNAERLIQQINENYSLDLIFLEVELPEMNGIELGRTRGKVWIKKFL